MADLTQDNLFWDLLSEEMGLSKKPEPTAYDPELEMLKNLLHAPEYDFECAHKAWALGVVKSLEPKIKLLKAKISESEDQRA